MRVCSGGVVWWWSVNSYTGTTATLVHYLTLSCLPTQLSTVVTSPAYSLLSSEDKYEYITKQQQTSPGKPNILTAVVVFPGVVKPRDCIAETKTGAQLTCVHTRFSSLKYL